MRGTIPKLQAVRDLPLVKAFEKPAKTDDRLLKTPFIDWCKTLQIKTIDGLKPFELFDWQVDFSQLILENPRIPITLLSSRQTGKTADILALLVWLCLSRYEFTGLLIHRKGDDCRMLARRAKKFIPDSERLESDSLSLIEFRNTGSQLHFRSCNPRQIDGAEGTGRGLASVDMVVIEESSHTSNTQDVLGVLGPTLTHSSMATILLIGTAGMKGTYYHSSLTDAFGGEQNLEAILEGIRNNTIEPYQVSQSKNRIGIITNWRAIPRFKDEGIDDKTGRPNYLIRIQKEQDLSDNQISSEHELVFDSDRSAAVFEFTDVMKAQRGEWEKPSDDGLYFAGVDGSGKPRPGRKGDYTVCCIVRKDGKKIRVVNLYRRRGLSFEKRYADISQNLNNYRPIETLIEANDGMGQGYFENISAGCPSLDINRFNNSKERKATIVNKIQLALERGDLIIPKSPLIDELLSFQLFDDGTMGAVGKDSHDDTVMALGLALKAARYGSRNENSNYISTF